MATTNGNFHNQEQYKPSEGYSGAEGIPEQSTSGGTNHDLSKDEVGWYFVEQYYTTLSKSPEKLHLFYGKRSQFVYGLEAEVANVSVGRHAIQERIKQLDFQECKVRVSNVDSLSSFDNIVIQVIGETSTKTSPGPRKFVQTFVLAKQPSGYFVLNDVWRYINDEEEDQSEQAAVEAVQAELPAAVVAEAAPASELAGDETTEVQQPKEEPASSVAAPGPEPDLVDKKLEEVKAVEVAAADNVAKEVHAEPSDETTEPAPPADSGAEEVSEEASKAPEKPREPTATPAAPETKSPAAAATPAPAPEPEKPAKPMTWASRAAAAAVGSARPAPALPKTATPPAAAQAKAPAPPAAAAPKPAPAAQRSETAPASAAQPQAALTQTGSEWQTAGSDSKRQNKPQPVVAQPEKEGTLGYVKYVTEKVQEADLRAALSHYGSLTYFDINREKNCAFVEFTTPEGYKAAVTANPHIVNGENVVVEQRRPKSTAYGGAQYAANRGGASARGRGRYDGARAGSQGGPNKAPFGTQTRGRGGGGGAPRGKSTTQPANA